jgi:uncharacterized RmlC-like cupin family protein
LALRGELDVCDQTLTSQLAGDFIFNPARVVHREITAPEEPAEFFVVRVGTGPQNVNVDGPDADPDGR